MSTDQTFDCVFCKEVFSDKDTLLTHFRKHGDPEFDKSTKNKSRPINDNITQSVDKPMEENETVGCDVCDEVFPTISKAITHKHKVHPDHDAKYFCPFCGKVFTMKHLFNKHLQSSHKNAEAVPNKDFYCDSCEVAFCLPSAMVYHNKFFHRQDTELPAVGQSKKIKLYNQEIIQIYYCAFCGEEYNNKVNLHKHMSDDHGDENQSPVDVFRCPLCEAIFYHLDAYELHLTFHSAEDVYSEKNEMFDDITEFSLESVPPLMVRIEDEEETDKQPEEDGANQEGIDSFLQLIMGESDNNEKVKHKKHKKHKKSKKSAITLDEFLNMNKDVFGDGFGDVQGIEEVPTQVVLNKAKGKRSTAKNESLASNADLLKLKKQGITVKTKSGHNAVKLKLSNNLINKPNTSTVISNTLKTKPNPLKTPNEILSKLMKQGNSQIKIIKKTVPSDNILSDFKPDEELPEEDGSQDCSDKDDTLAVNSKKMCEDQSDDNNQASDAQTVNENIDENDDCKNEDNAKEHLSTFSAHDPGSDSDERTVLHTSEENLKQNLLTDFNINKESESPKNNENTANFESLDKTNNKESDLSVANTTLDALKHLSHLITVKSLNQTKTPVGSPNGDKRISTEVIQSFGNNNGVDTESEKNIKPEQKIIHKPLNTYSDNIVVQPSKPSPSAPLTNLPSDAGSEDDDFNNDNDSNFDSIPKNDNVNKKLNIENLLINKDKSLSIKQKLPIISKPIAEKVNERLDTKNEDSPKKVSNLDILKRLTNVTAKPVPTNKNGSQPPTPPQKLESKIKEEIPKYENTRAIDEKIEIFNIDDSDSEDAEREESSCIKDNQVNKFQYIGKKIIMKSGQEQINHSKVTETKSYEKFSCSDKSGENFMHFNKQTPEIQKSINLQNKLKNLGSHITVKSRNPSPSMQNKEQTFENYDEFDDDEQAYNSDYDSEIGKVKITEINEDEINENEITDGQVNAIVQSPHSSNGDNEDYHEPDGVADFESQIKTNTLNKQNEIITLNKPSSCLDGLKNLNNLTIKSLSKKATESEPETNVSNQKEEFNNISANTSKEIVLKKPIQNMNRNERPINRAMPQPGASTNQTSLNQKTCTSSNQVNTVKTVKRFQSQTVIEEITTTVTKTVRTVNQSTNEFVQNTNQPIQRPMIRPQKIINKQPGKELQGTSVRHASPTVGTKIRTATNIVRPPNPNAIRPSNQLVPLRPTLNLPRPSGPNSTPIRKTVPQQKPTPLKPTLGKLKISPNAFNQTNKRLADETPGPFSCFKRAKETPITSDLAEFGDDESVTQFATSSQTRSDFSSVTKTFKGKSMVTATQMRSEVNTSSQQQLSKLSNVSGLKIMKTSSKQAMQVEEKCEVSAPKNNALAALQKLQAQGLLVKKPRVDSNEDPEPDNFYSDSDDETCEK